MKKRYKCKMVPDAKISAMETLCLIYAGVAFGMGLSCMGMHLYQAYQERQRVAVRPVIKPVPEFNRSR